MHELGEDRRGEGAQKEQRVVQRARPDSIMLSLTTIDKVSEIFTVFNEK